MSFYKKNEDTDDLDLFLNLNKSTVLQEARIFNVSPIKPRQCRIILAKVLFLMYTSESLTSVEATELFFSITKLFQSPGISLRQIIYLAIKELSTIAQDVIIITSSLTKDMQPQSEPMCRPNAIRALCKITDASMLPGIERFLKAAIVDKTDSSISSAALVSSYHMFPSSREIIRRWSNEVQEALVAKSSGFSSMVTSFMRTSAAPVINSTIVQYHALGLMTAIRQHDRMAISKLVQMFVGGGGMSAETLRDPFAHCYLIRLAAKSMEDTGVFAPNVYDKLCSWLRNRNDAVCLEAAKAICGMPGLTVEQVYPAVRALQQLLSSSKATLRFAAIRTINQVAAVHAAAMSSWKLGLDELISDPNRSVATFAITALLQIGTESTVDALIKQVALLMNDISDEFRVIVVDAIKSLGIKFPAKHDVLLGFLAGVLRDEGGYDFKKAVVDAIIQLTRCLPAGKEAALTHLCEFIEDCEYPKLSVKVLHFLGIEGPNASNPTLYIRFIYNRVVLETTVVRAAAVSALARFGAGVPDPKVKLSVQVLLTRCLSDPDDEVRDRAAFSLKVIQDEATASDFIMNEKVFHLATLEIKLAAYCNHSDSTKTEPFDMASIPTCYRGDEVTYQDAQSSMPPIVDPVTKNNSKPSGLSASATASATASPANQLVDVLQSNLLKLQEAIPEIEGYGPLIKSSPLSSAFPLTEPETEYAVQVKKHIFSAHIVFEFTITNTINDILLENLRVEMESEQGSIVDLLTEQTIDEMEPVGELGVESAPFDTPVTAYVVRAKPAGSSVSAQFACTLKFTAKDCDPATGEADEDGFEDDYMVDSLKLSPGDYMVPSILASPSEGGFQTVWDSLDVNEDSTNCQLVETFAPSGVESLQDAVSQLSSLFGMQIVDGHSVKPEATTHTMSLTGLYLNQTRSAVRVRMTRASGSAGVVVEATVRAANEAVARVIMSCVV